MFDKTWRNARTFIFLFFLFFYFLFFYCSNFSLRLAENCDENSGFQWPKDVLRAGSYISHYVTHGTKNIPSSMSPEIIAQLDKFMLKDLLNEKIGVVLMTENEKCDDSKYTRLTDIDLLFLHIAGLSSKRLGIKNLDNIIVPGMIVSCYQMFDEYFRLTAKNEHRLIDSSDRDDVCDLTLIDLKICVDDAFATFMSSEYFHSTCKTMSSSEKSE